MFEWKTCMFLLENKKIVVANSPFLLNVYMLKSLILFNEFAKEKFINKLQVFLCLFPQNFVLSPAFILLYFDFSSLIIQILSSITYR